MENEFLIMFCLMTVGSLAPYWVPSALEVIDVVIEKIRLSTKLEPYLQPADLGD